MVHFDKGSLLYLCYGCLCTIFGTLIYYLIYFIRETLLVTRNCWFCNSNVKVPFKSRNEWFCIYCNQFNGFTKDGDYAKSIPEQYDERLNQPLMVTGVGKYWKNNNGLCHICNANQELKVRQLAAYVPLREEHYDEEIEAFKKKLEESYTLCVRCEKVLKNTLQAKSNLVSKKVVNSIRNNEANKSDFERTRRNIYLAVGGVLLFTSFAFPFFLYLLNDRINLYRHLINIDRPSMNITFPLPFSMHFFRNVTYDSYLVYFLIIESFLIPALFAKRYSKFLILIARTTSLLLLTNDYLLVLDISGTFKMYLILIEVCGLLLYTVFSVAPDAYESKKSRASDIFVRNSSYFEEQETPDSVNENNEKETAHSNCDENEPKTNAAYKATDNVSVCNRLTSMNLDSLKSNQTNNGNNVEKINPFLKIRERPPPIIKQSNLKLNNQFFARASFPNYSSNTTRLRTDGFLSAARLRTDGFLSAARLQTTATSDSSNIHSQLDSNSSGYISATKTSLSPFSDTLSNIESVSQVSDNSPNTSPFAKRVVSPLSRYNYKTGDDAFRASSPIYVQYASGSVISASNYRHVLTGYSVIPTAAASCLNSSSGNSSASSSHSNTATSQYPSAANLTLVTICNVLLCCFSCFILGYCLKEIKT